MPEPEAHPAAQGDDEGAVLERSLPHLQHLSTALGGLAHSARLLAASGRVLWPVGRWGPEGEGRGWAGSSGAVQRALQGVASADEEGEGAREAGFAILAEPVRAPGGGVAAAFALRMHTRVCRPEHALLLRQAALGAERELAALAERQALEGRQDEILGLLSHDLRTPLSTLLMQAQLMRRGHDDPAKVQKRAGAILWSGTRLNTMIQELVDLGRLESQRMRIAPRPIALAPFWANIAERSSGVLDLQRIALDLSPDLPAVLADPDKLERILLTLLYNALRYSPEPSPVQLCATAERGIVALSVRDSGSGIDREEQPHLFERFHRSARTRPAPEGLGLGLYIAKLLTEAQGGSIGVESELGVGSTFEVRLPAAR